MFEEIMALASKPAPWLQGLRFGLLPLALKRDWRTPRGTATGMLAGVGSGVAAGMAEGYAKQAELEKFLTAAGQGIEAAQGVKESGTPIVIPTWPPGATRTTAPFSHASGESRPALAPESFSLTRERPSSQVGEAAGRRPRTPAQALRMAAPEQRRKMLTALASGVPPSLIFDEAAKSTVVGKDAVVIDEGGKPIFSNLQPGDDKIVTPRDGGVYRVAPRGGGLEVLRPPTLPEEKVFDPINASDFTPQSVAEFQSTGDRWVLRRAAAPQSPEQIERTKTDTALSRARTKRLELAGRIAGDPRSTLGQLSSSLNALVRERDSFETSDQERPEINQAIRAIRSRLAEAGWSVVPETPGTARDSAAARRATAEGNRAHGTRPTRERRPPAAFLPEAPQ